MLKIFTKQGCSACEDLKENWPKIQAKIESSIKKNFEAKFFDIETKEGLAEAAFHAKVNEILPFAIDVAEGYNDDFHTYQNLMDWLVDWSKDQQLLLNLREQKKCKEMF